MKAREIVFVLLVIAIGLSIQGARGSWRFGPFWSHEDRERDSYHEFAETKEVAADQTRSARVENIYGDVTVRGWSEPRISVTLRKRVYERHEEQAREVADKVHIVIRQNGEQTVVTSDRGQLSDRQERLRTDFEIVVPEPLLLAIQNEHGDIAIGNLRTTGAELRATHGDVALTNFTGDIKMTNEHTDTVVNDLTGSLAVENGYGDTKVARVSGDVVIKSLHGDASVQGVSGTLQVNNDYGEIRVKEVQKDVQLGGQRAEVVATDCSSNVTVNNTYESVRAENILGALSVRGEHSQVTFRRVGGEAKVETSYGDVEGSNVAGAVEIVGNHTSVDLRGIEGECKIKTSYDDVKVVDFTAGMDVNVQHGGCRLVPRVAPSAPIIVHTEYEDIHLSLPRGASFDLLAESLSGEIEVDYPLSTQNRSEQDQKVQLTGSTASGEGGKRPKIELRSSYGDVRVSQSGGGSSEDDD